MPRRAVISLFAVVASVLSSCSAPSSYEEFIRADAADSLGRFCFTLDMSDSLSSYDVSLYMRLDASDEKFETLPSVRVDASWLSPSGVVSDETVYIPKGSFVNHVGYARDCKVLYRSGIVPPESGKWTLMLSLPSVAECSGFRGIGVILK